MNNRVEPNFTGFRNTLMLKEKMDRVPLFDFNIDPIIKEKIIDRKIACVKDEIDFWVQAGYDYIQIRLKPLIKADLKIADLTRQYHGDLNSLEQLRSGVYEWTEIYNDTWNLKDYNLAMIEDIAKLLPENMKLIVHAADIFTRSWMIMGFENFCFALYENTELVSELFYQNAMAEIKMLNVTFDSIGDKIGAILYSDDLAYSEGLMISLKNYREYLWPYVKKITQIAKTENIPVIYHTDGCLWELLDDFYEMGINGLQPLEPKSMDLKELKAKRGHQFCLLGSIDIDLLSRGTPQEINLMVNDRIKMLGYNGGYMVGSSNTIPDFVNIDNYIAMIETAKKYDNN